MATHSKNLPILAQHQGTNAQFTVVQKLHQGTGAQRGCNPCLPTGRLCAGLFCFFLDKQKEKKKTPQASETKRIKEVM